MRKSKNKKEDLLNIVIIGKSGAGKSSFLNYLIGENHFKVGEGSPVTQAYFEDYLYEVPDTGVHYHLYDTKGIEPTTTAECRNKILYEIRKRDNLGLFEWIHTVYYCFDASSKRIQPFEINFINELKKYVSIVILLTKKDLVSKDDLDALVSQIEKEIDSKVQIVPVCSVEQRTRKGSSHKEGKEDVLKASFLGLWEKLANSYPRHIVDPIFKEFPIELNSYVDDDDIRRTINALKYNETYLMLFPPKEEILKIAKKIIEIETHKLSLDYLCNFPLIEELGGDDVHGDLFVVSLMKRVNEYIKYLSQHIPRHIDLIWDENTKIHRKVFSFYQKVNRVRPRVLYSDIAKGLLQTIANYEIDGEKLSNLTNEIQERYKEVAQTLIFDGNERIAVYDCFYKYRDLVMKIGIKLNILINAFLTSYRAELLQYGQYCLKKESKKEEMKIIDSEGELSSDERIYYHVVLDSLEDRKIEKAERFMLERLSSVLDISFTRAGLIEDFARKILDEMKN